MKKLFTPCLLLSLGILSPCVYSHLHASPVSSSQIPDAATPNRLATQWVRHALNFIHSTTSYETESSHSLEELISSLPPPDQWESLKIALENETGNKRYSAQTLDRLRFYLAFLTADFEAQWELIDRLQPIEETHHQQATFLGRLLGASRSSAPPVPFYGYEAISDWLLAASPAEMYSEELILKNLANSTILELTPYLMNVVEREKLESIVMDAITSPEKGIWIEDDKELVDWLKTVFKKYEDNLNQNSWQAVAALNAPDIFEKLYAGDHQGPRNHARDRAILNYTLLYINEGNEQRARELVLENQHLDLWHQANIAIDQYAFLYSPIMDFAMAVLRDHPEAPLRRLLIQAAIAAERSDEAISFLNEQKEQASTLTRREQDERAITEIKFQQGDLTALLSRLDNIRGQTHDSDHFEELQKAIAVGYFTDSAEVSAKALDVFSEMQISGNLTWRLYDILNTLIVTENHAAAEAFINRVFSAWEASQSEPFNYTWMTFDVSRLSVSLIHLYMIQGKTDEAWSVLEDGYWAHHNINGFTTSIPAREQASLARLLHQRGKKEEARALASALLHANVKSDPVYSVYLELTPPEQALATFNQLATVNLFEERPLVWKAELLRREGRLDEAYEAAQAAIQRDPSDGDSPRGDRMRVYGILGEILIAQGKQEEGEFYQDVVRAIRMAEDADILFDAGLIVPALALYRESTQLFDDAYCIQSRMAVQLYELGRHEEAEAHYRKAYELMPSSFGRQESHCFGCEGAFRGELAKNIAEEVFTRLIAENPTQAQPYYLLGYLKEALNDYPAAITYYEKAIELDPLYVSAWNNLLNSVDSSFFNGEKRQQVALDYLENLGAYNTNRWLANLINEPAKVYKVNIKRQLANEVPTVSYPLDSTKFLAVNKQARSYYSEPRVTHNHIDFTTLLLGHEITSCIFD